MAENRVEKLEKEIQALQTNFSDIQKNLKTLTDKQFSKVEASLSQSSHKLGALAHKGKTEAQHLWGEIASADCPFPYHEEIGNYVKKHPIATAATIGSIAAIIATILVKRH